MRRLFILIALLTVSGLAYGVYPETYNPHTSRLDKVGVDTITDIATGLKSGTDGTLVTGTKGATGICAEWNADGDLVAAASAAACGAGGVEVNNLETATADILTTEIPIGQAAGESVYHALSGGATMTEGGVVTIVTNANLTGPVTSVGNATAIASQTGTGTKFVVDTSPTLVTPELGEATGTGLTLSGLTASEILGTNADKKLVSLAVATYPSLAELAYVKGVTSAVQTQMDTKSEKKTIGITIDGGGSAIATGVKGFVEVVEACTISQATVLLDQSGSIVIDVWKDTYANYPPTDADSITSSTPPTVTSATKSQDSTLTSWTTSVGVGDIIGFNVDSITTATRATLTLECDV